ncbi:MAG: YdcF family protein [Oscillospiraceae bacterium]|nr:YdcF family protein [Oscillospiraceae bacterium]
MIIVFIAVAGLGALVLGATGALILHAGAPKPEPDCETIIVLGHRNKDGSIGVTMDERISRAALYLKDHPHTTAVLSGGHGEAEYMFAALTAAGIDANRLILEKNSVNTWQNLKFSLPLTEGKTIGILSSDFHLFRARMYIRRRNIGLIPAKTQDFKRWARNFCREIAGVWHNILLGGTYDERYLR